jgi:hypothetical protein
VAAGDERLAEREHRERVAGVAESAEVDAQRLAAALDIAPPRAASGGAATPHRLVVAAGGVAPPRAAAWGGGSAPLGFIWNAQSCLT